jgi:trimeric autotransporter adhesin
MKARILIIMVWLLVVVGAYGQGRTNPGMQALCLSSNGWIPLFVGGTGQPAAYRLQQVPMFGANGYPVACDTNGVLGGMIPGLTITGSGASQLATFPGTIAGSALSLSGAGCSGGTYYAKGDGSGCGPGGSSAPTTTSLLKGNNAGGMLAAVPGTDYLTPTGNGSSLTGIAESQVANLTSDLAAKAPTAVLFPTGLAAYYHFDECFKSAGQCGTSYTITDYSGNGNTPTLPISTAIPTLTTQGLTFSQTVGQYLILPSALNSARVIQVWFNYPGNNAAITSQNQSVIIGNSVSNSGLSVYNSPTYNLTNGEVEYRVFQPSIVSGGYQDQAYDTAVGDHLLTMYLGTNSSTDPDRFYIDQAEVSSYAYQGASAGHQTTAGGNLYLGWHGNAAVTGSFHGTIRALAVYTSVTGGSAAAMFANLAQNYEAIKTQVRSTGVNLSFPQSQSQNNQITCVGDSITSEPPINGTHSYCTPSVGGASLNDTYTLNNVAVAGEQCAEMLANHGAREDTNFTTQSGKNVATLFCGTNEFNASWSTSISAAGVWKTITAWAAAKHAMGWKIGFMTMISRNGTAASSGHTFDYWKNALNTLARANAYQYFDFLIDSAADSNLGCDGCSTNGYFGADHTHPVQTGLNLLGTYWSNGINAYFGSSLQACDPTVITATTYTSAAADGCKSFDTVSNNITDTLPSSVGYTNRVIYVCNQTSGGSNTLTVAAFGSEYINKVGTTTITVATGKCQALRGTVITPATPVSFWSQIN